MKHLLVLSLLVVLTVLFSCAQAPVRKPPVIIELKIQSEIPVNVSVHKSCKDNWNFCQY